MLKLQRDIVCFCFLLFFSISLSSFSQIKITGTVSDLDKNIVYANVVFSNENNFKGTITNNKGEFNAVLKEGNYLLTISYIGYKNYAKQIQVTKEIKLAPIQLEKDEVVLNEVVINQQKQIIKQIDDKLVFDVSNSYLKTGYDGVEILKRVPSVYVNGREHIYLRNEKATILINGRRIRLVGDDLTNYLKSIAASNIKRIEVQQIASAETDANIKGGIINIILKKKLIGFRESFKYYYKQQQKYPKHYAYTNFNYGAKKWNIYGAALYKNAQNSIDIETNVYHTNQSKRFDEKSKLLIDLSKQLIGRIGATFEPIKNHEFGFEVYATKYKFGTDTNSNLNIITSNLLEDNGTTKSNNREDKTYYNTSFNYSIKLDSLGGKLNFIADYAKQKLNRKVNATTQYRLGVYDNNTERNKTGVTTNLIAAQLDYSKKIYRFGKLETGIKIRTNTRNNNTLTETLENNNYQTDLLRTTKYDFKENIYAAYVSIAKKVAKKTTLKLGLRIENTNLNGKEKIGNTEVVKNYTDYFPHFYISQKITKKRFVSFSYNRKIKRPQFRVLNPYITKINDFYYQIGNPKLQPEYRSNFDLSYHFNSSTLAIYNKNTKNLMLESYALINNIAYYQFKNDGDNNQVGIDFSYHKKVTKQWYLKVNTSVYNQHYKLFKERFNHNTFTITMNNDYKITKTWKTNLSADYSSSKLTGNYLIAPNFVTNFMVEKLLLKKQLKLRLYVNDVFNTRRDKDLAKFTNFNTSFYRKRITQTFSIWAMFTIKTKGKVRRNKNETANDSKTRL